MGAVMMLLAALKNYSGRILLSILALGLAVVLGLAVRELFTYLSGGTYQSKEISLPLLAIGGVVVLILLLTLVATIFSIIGLTDKQQPMGLPEGSIRAVIALSLIVLFAILSVFLYQGVLFGSSRTIAGLSQADLMQFLKDHPNLSGVSSSPSIGANKAPDGSTLYDITYRDTNATSDDFAKQLLVLLGTLMTAVTSFYLGAGTATSAAAAVQTAATPPPTVSGIQPAAHAIATDGPVVHLRVMGNNLNIITQVKIARAGLQIVGTNVSSNPTGVTCNIPVSAATTPPGPPWDVVVDDGGSNSASLPAALTIS